MYAFGVCVCVYWKEGCVCHTSLVEVRGNFCVVSPLFCLYMGLSVLTRDLRIKHLLSHLPVSH